MQKWQLSWGFSVALWVFCLIVSSSALKLMASLQPWSPPSFLLPYLLSAFLLNPVGSAALTLVADHLRRIPGDPRFFWRHWWHFPFLAGATWIVTWYLNGGFEVFPRNPLITLLAVFTAIHLAWLLLTDYAVQRNRRERPTPKAELPSISS